jgi:hypothetical protein
MSNVVDEVVHAAEDHLGFAARRYLERQARLHMDKDLDDLGVNDLDDLAKWVNNTGALVASPEAVEELRQDILKIQEKHQHD